MCSFVQLQAQLWSWDFAFLSFGYALLSYFYALNVPFSMHLLIVSMHYWHLCVALPAIVSFITDSCRRCGVKQQCLLWSLVVMICSHD